MAEDRLLPAAPYSQITSGARPKNFVSLRWKILLLIVIAALPFAMSGTYIVSGQVARNIHTVQSDRLANDAQNSIQQITALREQQFREAERIAFTANVASMIVARNSAALQSLIQPVAAAGALDVVIVADATKQELVGLRQASPAKYVATQGARLDTMPFLDAVLSGALTSASEIDMTDAGYVLFTAVPVVYSGKTVGVAVAGVSLTHLLNALPQNAAVFGSQGQLLAASTKLSSAELLAPDPETRQAAVSTANAPVTLRSVQSGSDVYQAAYVGLPTESGIAAVAGIFQPDTTLINTETSRQSLSLTLAGLVGFVLIFAFVGISFTLRKLGRVTRTAEALAGGNVAARTNMQPTDEIGQLGSALDEYAQRMQDQSEALEASLRQQRRESAQLTAVLESIPDGIIVQDLDGRVVLMNRGAFRLLGSKRVFRSSPLNELTAIVTDKLGAALMPGVFSLGEPQRVPLDGKILHAQAAAVVSRTQVRIGTVIILRDVTDEVNREQRREKLLVELAEEAQAPVPAANGTLRGERLEDTLQRFIQDVNHNAIVLQRMISEIRDISLTDARTVQSTQQALSAETLLWKIAREWQPTANSAGIELHVLILARGLYILGEEQRLRWAIGNIVDNSIKYSPRGGHVSLALRVDENETYARFLIKDAGYGLSSEDQANAFNRFYRGKPVTATGEPLTIPGTGQGLFIAKRVIEAHGGTIRMKSRPGRGTEVLFDLPLTADVTLGLNQLPAEAPAAVSEEVPLNKPGKSSGAERR